MSELRESADRLEDQQQELRLRQEDNSRLVHLATTDGLTGLKNHLTFQENLANLFERSRLCSLPLSLILVDVDRFKMYN